MWAGCGDPAPEPGALPEHIPHGPSLPLLPLLLLTRRTCLARSCRQAVRSVRFDSLPTSLISPPSPGSPSPSDSELRVLAKIDGRRLGRASSDVFSSALGGFYYQIKREPFSVKPSNFSSVLRGSPVEGCALSIRLGTEPD